MSKEAKQAQVSIIADWSPNNIEHYVQKAIDDVTADLRTKLAAAEAELKALREDKARLLSACNATLLFHSASPWNFEKKQQWMALMQDCFRTNNPVVIGATTETSGNIASKTWDPKASIADATTRVLCNAVRQAIDQARKDK